MYTVAIDPGVAGGYAFFYGNTLQTSFCFTDIQAFIAEIKTNTKQLKAVIEHVHASPQMGTKNGFTFGYNFGCYESALLALDIPVQRVRPQVWQKQLDLDDNPRKSHKKKLRDFAHQVFPNHKFTLATCDAALLGYYYTQLRPQNER